MTTLLQVATPEGDSGRMILGSGGDYLFRYHEVVTSWSSYATAWPK